MSYHWNHSTTTYALIGWFALGLAGAQAASFHVAPAGSDENPGTEAKPFRTIQKAADVAQAGDRVFVRAGLYSETVSPKRSGAAGGPIVFEGERGHGGEWLSIIDATVPIVGWEAAPEVGPGVFKTTALDFNPHSMTLDGKQLARIRNEHMNSGVGFRLLQMPAAETIRDSAALGSVPYVKDWVSSQSPDGCVWDGVEVFYGHRQGTTYIRFRDGDDPNGKELRAGQAGAVVTITDQSHIVLRGLLIRSGQVAVHMRGPRATHNVVEDCCLSSKRTRVVIEQGAGFNILRNNTMTMDYYGFSRPKSPPRGYIYRVFKYIVGPNTSDDTGVIIRFAGEANEVVGNEIHDGTIGVDVGQSLRARVHGNVIRNMWSIGICTSVDRGKGAVDGEFHDNLVLNCGISLRIHSYTRVEPGQRREYHYRNVFCQTGDRGVWHVFVHWPTPEMLPGTDHSEIFLYHNSLVGGQRGMQPNLALPRGLLINNIFSARWPWFINQDRAADKGLFAAFDHNWCGGSYQYGGRPAWLGPNNILAQGRQMWATSDHVPDFRLPVDSDTRQAGVDLSRPFAVQGRSFPALPGMKPGYFKGRAPDLGAVQSGQTVPVWFSTPQRTPTSGRTGTLGSHDRKTTQ